MPESRKQRKAREAKNKQHEKEYQERIRLEEEMFRHRKMENLKRMQDRQARQIKQIPISSLSIRVVEAMIKFLCWIDQFSFSRACRAFSKVKRTPFKEILHAFIAKNTELDPKNVFFAIEAGLSISGSTLHQCIYGVEYKGSDIDFYYKKSAFSAGADKRLNVNDYFTILYPPPPKDEGKKEYFILCQSDGGILESDDYTHTLPVTSAKYFLDVQGMKTRDSINSFNNPKSMINKTIIEMVNINYFEDVQEFMDKMVDISFCMLYYDKDGLHYRNMKHLLERTFTMNWDLKRYLSKLNPYETRRERNMKRDMLDKIANKLLARKEKYEERGFRCLNGIEYEDEYFQQVAGQINKIAPEIPLTEEEKQAIKRKIEQEWEDERRWENSMYDDY